ncbi:hypothetical protein [Photobacterium sp. OFAV2-7]|uniref:hypothetical protein n=1 Tax=Photobacterium sp. OFAV2-7 TaxID=2917748 RepID=UPI001EF5BD2A|nr:hypothetical protein [Photobacterium sp. OFAV2-7]MCG7584583.1 hypothetical protein [Photobacterium sp. OFAV2-7]
MNKRILIKTAAMMAIGCFSITSASASGEWPFPFNVELEGGPDILQTGDDIKDFKLEPLASDDLKVNLIYTHTGPGTWRISAKWGTSKSSERKVQAPEGYEYCRAVTHQRGNKGGLSVRVHTARSVTFRLYTRGGTFYDRWTGWQEGWYDITWISDNANKTHRDAHSCV